MVLIRLLCFFLTLQCWGGLASDVRSIVHLSDIHYDPYYAEGSPADCLTGQWGLRCCQVSSIPTGSRQASPWGDFNCDSPKQLVESTIAWIGQHLQYDYVFYTGDTVSHHDFEQILNWPESLDNIQFVTRLLSTLNVPFYSVLGNHDGTPAVDQLWGPWPVLPDVAQMWENNTLTNWANISGFGRGGYYAVPTELGNITGTNCLWFDIHNVPVWLNTSQDLGNQYAWMKQHLSEPSNAILISHMAPRSGEATLAYSQFMNTVHPRLEVYGHTHSNAYRIVRNEDGSVRVAYITGSVVPDNHYPMFRRYFFNLTSQTVLNYETYYLNLTRQQTSNSFIGYELLYSARQAYGLPDLSPFSWVDLTRRMQTNQTLFQLYCNHMAPPQTECDQKGTLCDIDEIYC